MLALVIALHPHHHRQNRTLSHRTLRASSGLSVTRRVFRRHWRQAWCISYYESRHTLTARNGANLGPWQINTDAHPWASPHLLTHSWLYSARAARRISSGGRDWSAWTTHGLCGV